MWSSIFLTLVLFLLSVISALYVRYRRWYGEFPVRDTSFIFGSLPAIYRRRKDGSALEHVAALGDIAQSILPLGLSRFVLIGDADWAEYIVAQENSPKNPLVYNELDVLKGSKSILTLYDNEEWRRIRRAAAHAFSPTSLRAQMPVLEKVLATWLRKLDAVADTQVEMEFDSEFIKVTFDFISESSFGIAFNAVEDSAGEHARFLELVSRVLLQVNYNSFNPFRKFFPSEAMRNFKRDCIEGKRIAEKFIREANIDHNLSEQRATSIWAAVSAIDNISDIDRLSNFLVFVIAGHDTTAHGMAFTLLALVRHPDIFKRAVAEVDAVLGQSTRIANSSHIPQLTFLADCFREGVRMYPPVPGTARVLDSTKTINGLTITKGTTVFVSSLMINNNPRYWKDPRVYNPDRWTKGEGSEESRPKCAFFAFSGGPRDCVGKLLAQHEAVMVLATLLKNFTFELDPNYVVGMEFSITNKPRSGLPLKVRRRKID